MIRRLYVAGLALGLTLLLSSIPFSAISSTGIQTDERKDASEFTIAANAELIDLLPFDDTSDFDNAMRGFIAPLPSDPIVSADGSVIWDPGLYDFIELGSSAPATVNPSLWRQAQLINISGLFQVTDRIYQVRNYDLSNITFVEGDTGLIVIDPLISKEVAAAALELYFENRPRRDVVAVIYSHSHIDHYGGVKGIVSEDDVNAGNVQIIAPVNFLNSAVSENVLAGNAMTRRASYMYGALLPADAKASVGAGLGIGISLGTVTLIPPTVTITGQETMTIDGLTFEFLNAPNTEAPAEMHWYIRELQALSTAENATHTLHNVYSLRGTKVRDPLAWSKSLNDTRIRWGEDAEVLFGMHHWPVFGNSELNAHLTRQRDLYRFINDQTLRLANQGFTMLEIAEMIELPNSLATFFSARGYYGAMNHNVKAAYNRYLGFFDGNPATLHPLPPAEAGAKYVEFMGGADNLLALAQESFDRGEYRWVAEVVNHLVFSDPSNEAALNLQADALEQLGYQAESGPWRNFYLSGAQELRDGVDAAVSGHNSASPDTIRALDLDSFFDFLGVHINADKADGIEIKLNFIFTDTNQLVSAEVVNSVLNHSNGVLATAPNATIIMTRITLNDILTGELLDVAVAIEQGTLQVLGNPVKVIEFFRLIDKFSLAFNIVTP